MEDRSGWLVVAIFQPPVSNYWGETPLYNLSARRVRRGQSS